MEMNEKIVLAKELGYKICRNGHLKTPENVYHYHGTDMCRICARLNRLKHHPLVPRSEVLRKLALAAAKGRLVRAERCRQKKLQVENNPQTTESVH